VAANTPYPVVFALSNPTANSEAVPEDLYRWTEGRALVATGSPFEDVMWDGAAHPVGQGNNAFIFPGLGLGVLTCRARRVTDGMLTAAALALSEFVDKGRLARGALYPRMDKIRVASKQVAIAVIQQARKEGVAAEKLPEDLEAHLEARMWRPEFLPIRKARGA
jgi:malate dehydrogenase (oxaloacetate-decarboxylating)